VNYLDTISLIDGTCSYFHRCVVHGFYSVHTIYQDVLTRFMGGASTHGVYMYTGGCDTPGCSPLPGRSRGGSPGRPGTPHSSPLCHNYMSYSRFLYYM